MALEAFRIPLNNVAQRFAINLSGRSFIMVNVWNQEHNNWEISMLDGDTEEYIFACMPLVTGVDLLKQFAHLGINGSLIVYTDGNELATPTETNLGVESNLYYLVDQQ